MFVLDKLQMPLTVFMSSNRMTRGLNGNVTEEILERLPSDVSSVLHAEGVTAQLMRAPFCSMLTGAPSIPKPTVRQQLYPPQHRPMLLKLCRSSPVQQQPDVGCIAGCITCSNKHPRHFLRL